MEYAKIEQSAKFLKIDTEMDFPAANNSALNFMFRRKQPQH